MQHPDEGTIHAWLDGELPPEESAALEAHVAECSECSAMIAEARGLIAASSRIVSALDIVPGGVIPVAAPKRRPWYASTQLRAAAAVLIVAGASALVMRNGGKQAMENAVTVSAPIDVPAAGSLPVMAAAPESAAAESDLSARADQAMPRAKAVAGSARKPYGQNQKMREAAKAPTPPPPPAPAAVEPQALRIGAADAARPQSAAANEAATAMRRSIADSSRQLRGTMESIVVTGVATASAPPPEFKKLRTDSANGAARTTFAVNTGGEVELVDVAPRQARFEKSGTIAAAPSAPPAQAKPREEVFTITWTDKRGHRMTLRGPVPLQVLERLRQTLPEDQR